MSELHPLAAWVLAASALSSLVVAGCGAPRVSYVSRWSGGDEEVVGKERGFLRGSAHRRDGEAVYWYTNGVKFKQGRYRDGEPDGLWTFWHPNGVRAAEGRFSDGNRDGIWTQWDTDGRTLAEAVFDQGVLVQGNWIPMPDPTGPGSERDELAVLWEEPGSYHDASWRPMRCPLARAGLDPELVGVIYATDVR